MRTAAGERDREIAATALLALGAIGFAWSLLPAFFAAFAPWGARSGLFLILPLAIVALLALGMRRYRAGGLAVMAPPGAPGAFALALIVGDRAA